MDDFPIFEAIFDNLKSFDDEHKRNKRVDYVTKVVVDYVDNSVLINSTG